MGKQLKPLSDLLTDALHTSTAAMAYSDLKQFIEQLGGGPAFLKTGPALNPREVFANRFAQEMVPKLAGCISESPMPDNYASWLMFQAKTGEMGIALNRSQMQTWAGDDQRPTLPPDFQCARAILHEVGHVKTTPHLLAAPEANPEQVCVAGASAASEHGAPLVEPPLVPSAEPEDEVLPWLYAIVVLGSLLSWYSYEARVRERKDDTPRVPL